MTMISNMIFDNWSGVKNTEEVADSPVWGAIESALEKLDEKERTLISLNRSDGMSLFIGGGNGRFICVLSGENRNLIAKSGAEEERLLVVVGGQEGDFRKRNVLSLDQAKSVASNYFNGRDDLNSAVWENQ
jgi:hypothetical protein